MRDEPADDQRTWLSVDLVAITDDPDDPALVLYRRERAPHAGQLSLPGAVMDPARGQTVAQTAGWIADERAHTQVLDGTEPFPITVVSDPSRDERGHTVSLVCLTRVCSPGQGAVLIRAGDRIPAPMPFGHDRMLAAAAGRAFDGLFTDSAVARALVSTDAAHGTTGTGLWSTLRLLHHLAGRDPEHAPTAEAVRRRRSRTTVLVPGGKVAAVTRPETVYVSTDATFA
ncbi:NUDIX hydrolase [Mycobacterium sp. URHD0025]|uniref:NUDIX hydrolase n=1 Tax=Mycobacterium sp. URHD0025 TaxID=1298864 RepID=UPI0004183EC0|nr:NUDIX hydrolase [Mycobacterium sp. URHD0025]